ncbi:glycosyltransferase [Leisingera sp. MMG026]|uniref:glycosyltransferase family 2 protein n=1 Tax=Leisingera sp. MMG026 TaxID=2909982 RepID=UPI001F194D21|nr:glycosyltransferase [Leisingera sp. MMG026]MCF6430609.1 glycosyltransferase [Leisingera sp. MMG026]
MPHAQPELPRITVAIAAHDADACITAAVQSALAQDQAAVSVIVADDASRDGTAGTVARIAANDRRVSLVRSPVNLGPGGARNLAFAAAEDDWIAVLDSDDSFRPGRLARMHAHAQQQDADIVIDDFISVDAAGQTLPGPGLAVQRPAGVLDLADWLRLNDMARAQLSFGYAKPLLSRRFLLQNGLRYNESLRNGEDFHLILEALAAGARLYFTGETGYRYTRRAGSVSRRAQGDHMRALLAADKAVAARFSPAQHAAAARPLAARRRNLQNLITTEEVLANLKARHPGAAAARLARHPGALGRVTGHLAEALRKRIGARG